MRMLWLYTFMRGGRANPITVSRYLWAISTALSLGGATETIKGTPILIARMTISLEILPDVSKKQSSSGD